MRFFPSGFWLIVSMFVIGNSCVALPVTVMWIAGGDVSGGVDIYALVSNIINVWFLVFGLQPTMAFGRGEDEGVPCLYWFSSRHKWSFMRSNIMIDLMECGRGRATWILWKCGIRIPLRIDARRMIVVGSQACMAEHRGHACNKTRLCIEVYHNYFAVSGRGLRRLIVRTGIQNSTMREGSERAQERNREIVESLNELSELL